MSNAGLEDRAAETGAAGVEAAAAAWVRRRHFADWTAEDEAALNAWLNQSTAHEIAYLRLEAAWERTERLHALHPFKPEEAGPARKRFRMPLSLAAGLSAVAVIAAASFPWLAQPKDAVYSTPVGGREIVKLADGSQIELNTDTVLHLSPDQRGAVLERGEAYFQIRHDAEHPFTLKVAGRRVVDLGTKFLVRDRQSEVDVALIEGRARLESQALAAPEHGVILTPGEVAVATRSAISVKKVSTHDLSNALSWRRGLLVFHNATLGEAAAVLNRYNENKLVIDDPKVANLTINGTFRTNDNQVFARMAEDVFGLKATYSGNTTRISR